MHYFLVIDLSERRGVNKSILNDELGSVNLAEGVYKDGRLLSPSQLHSPREGLRKGHH